MATSFRTRKLGVEECAALGRNTVFEIDYAGLSGAGATTSTILTLISSLAAKFEISRVRYHLPAAFVGASITAMKMDVGVTSLTTDFINQAEVVTATPTPAGPPDLTISTTTVDETYATPESTVLTNLRSYVNQMIGQRKVITSAVDVLATFTATGANLSALTAGRVVILAQVVDLSKYDARGA